MVTVGISVDGVNDASGATEVLGAFRGRFYASLGRRADALFELTDAILTAGVTPSPAHLSLQAVHRRGWGSLCAALSKGSIDVDALRDLLARYPLAEGGPGSVPRVYAVDQSAWPRCDAEGQARARVLLPSQPPLRRPALPTHCRARLRARLMGSSDGRERVRPEEDANEVAAEQVRALVSRLVRRDTGGSEAPLFVFDASYDPVRLQRDLEGCRAQILVRLHSGRAFYADPPTPERKPVGRPFVHGKKFDLKDQKTWHEPSTEHSSEDIGYGKVRVRAWSGLHPKTRRAGERYGSQSAAVVRGTVVLVEVERLPRGEHRRKPKRLWLWWHGENDPDLDLLWRSYVRRFDLKHAIKFCKGTLGWTTPRVRHPEQADRWT